MEPKITQPFCSNLEDVVFQLMLELEDFKKDHFNELSKILNVMDDTLNDRPDILHILQVVMKKRSQHNDF